MFCEHKTSAETRRAFNMRKNPRALCCVFMWLEGLKEAHTQVHEKMLRGLSDFPSGMFSLSQFHIVGALLE